MSEAGTYSVDPAPTGASPRPIERGDRFLSTADKREEGRVVQVTEVLSGNRYSVVNDEAPLNTSTVGRKSIISEHRLRKYFQRISR